MNHHQQQQQDEDEAAVTEWITEELDLESLEFRRVRQDLIFTYKLVFGSVDLNVHDFFRCSFEKVRRGHGYKLFLPTCHSSTRFNFFAYRVLRIWNVLPHDTDFSSLAGFKRSLNTNILQKFLKVYFN